MTEAPTTDLYQLSDRLGVAFDAECVEPKLWLHDTASLKLSNEETWALVTWWLDGYCPICGDSINQGHHLCSTCAAEESRIWAGYGY